METDDLTWLNARYVEKVLQKSEDDDSIKVSNITVKPATAKGDNYLSNLQRVVIEFSRNQEGHEITETRSVIVKIKLVDGAMKDLVMYIAAFETEISMMSETLPKINKMLAELNASSLSARCLHVQNEDPTHLIMEDLVTEGFRMHPDRQAGLDLDHCLFILRNLAIFHASSVAIVEKDPMAVRIHKKTVLNKNYEPDGNGFVNSGTRTLAEEAINWPGLSPRIVEKVLRLSTCLFEKVCDAAMFSEDDFNVLNHGDCWTNNLMFRYDEHQNPIDIKFVDFQFSYYASPAVDILCFLGTITSEDIRINNREFLLREYHDSLTSTMAKLKCNTKAPSLDILKEILRKRISIEVGSSFAILPLVLVDKSQVSSTEAILGLDGKSENHNYRGNLVQKVMTKILLLYDGMGLLDL